MPAFYSQAVFFVNTLRLILQPPQYMAPPNPKPRLEINLQSLNVEIAAPFEVKTPPPDEAVLLKNEQDCICNPDPESTNTPPPCKIILGVIIIQIVRSTYLRVIFVTTSNIGDKTARSNFQSIILTFYEHSSTERGSIVDKSSVDYFYASNSTS